MKYHEISISDPLTGDVEKFNSISEAKKSAFRRLYTPVYINLYDENGIIDDIVVNVFPKNPSARLLGSIKSLKKAKSSRENGKKGGRPKKTI